MDKQHQLSTIARVQQRNLLNNNNKLHYHDTEYEEEVQSGPQPKFVLDNSRYLIPLLYNGPNNQMIGFQQSVLLSVLLNRFDYMFFFVLCVLYKA